MALPLSRGCGILASPGLSSEKPSFLEPSFTDLFLQMLPPASSEGPTVDLPARVNLWLKRVCLCLGLEEQEPHPGERAAFVAYALAFPRAFQGLLDSYSVCR